MELALMTFNLRIDVPEDGENAWPNRIHSVVQLLNQSEIMIIGTQEDLGSMLDVLSQSLPNYTIIGQAGNSTSEYCGIYYRHDVLKEIDSGHFWLSETPNVPNSSSWDSALPRICNWARFQFLLRPETEFLVYNTHLDHEGQQAREKGIKLIYQLLQEHRVRFRLPAILMGDLNAEPENPVVKFLRGQATIDGKTSDLLDAFAIIPKQQQVGCTFHDFKGGINGELIDYIFVTPDITISSTKIIRDRIDGRYPSDHYPVFVKLSFA